MAEILQGKLRRIAERGKPAVWRVTWNSRKGTAQTLPPDAGTLAPDLVNAAESEIDVELELEKGRPVRIRRAGTSWVAPASAATAGRGAGGVAAAGPGRQAGNGAPGRVGHFHNPYNFVPAPEPSSESDGPPACRTPLGRGAPVGHKAWFDDYYSGRLEVDIEVVTPLLVPDASRATKRDSGHTILPLLTENDDGRTPKLPPTSFKGALRAAYEAITNSRFGVFQGHKAPLGRRMEAGEGLAMVPARIAEDGRLELWMGTLWPRDATEFQRKCPQADRKPPGNVMYAAWLRRYHRGGSSRQGPAYDRDAIRYPDGTHPRHGDPVVCWLRKAQKTSSSGQVRFSYWRVEAIRKGHDLAALPPRRELGNPPVQFGNFHRLVDEEPIRAWGYVSVTNQNIGNKHDERVFFVPEGGRPYRANVPPDDFEKWSDEWAHLVADYRAKAKKIVDARKSRNMPLDAYEAREIGKTALSRHICVDGSETLQPRDLCFAKVDPRGRVVGLYPVMISREVARISPKALLPPGLHPARSLDELSPADRVFGWVAQSGGKERQRRAYKGQLRIASLNYLGYTARPDGPTEPTTRFDNPGLPLAILSTPKPEQVRFYVAKDKSGTPQRDGISKSEAAYDHDIEGKDRSRKGLRGRKVYPHHRALPERYWDGPAAFAAARAHPDQPQQVGDRFREYVRTAADIGALRDDQNRSIGGWVNPGVRFRAAIDVVNLSEAELGALLWLLTLPDDCYFRLGGGKPLGFGSVRVSLAGFDLADGAGMRSDLLKLLPDGEEASRRLRDPGALDEVVVTFKTALARAYGAGRSFEDIPLVAAFLNTARGFADGKPVHYPRAAASGWDGTSPVPPDPEGKNYEWFVQNDRTSRFDSGPRQSLEPLSEPRALPMLSVSDPGRVR